MWMMLSNCVLPLYICSPRFICLHHIAYEQLPYYKFTAFLWSAFPSECQLHGGEVLCLFPSVSLASKTA